MRYSQGHIVEQSPHGFAHSLRQDPPVPPLPPPLVAKLDLNVDEADSCGYFVLRCVLGCMARQQRLQRGSCKMRANTRGHFRAHDEHLAACPTFLWGMSSADHPDKLLPKACLFPWKLCGVFGGHRLAMPRDAPPADTTQREFRVRSRSGSIPARFS